MNRLKSWLAHPLTRSLDIDDPRTTNLRRWIIQQKPFLKRIYQEWYADLAIALPEGNKPILELGSGAGFLSEVIPSLITSDIFNCTGIDIVLDGQQLPIANNTLRAIVMTNVLHHLPSVSEFFVEAARTVYSGGFIIMIEPWLTPWSQLVYTKWHHEPFQPQAPAWEFPSSGPLSDANGALPWMIFQRDRKKFENLFPEWQIHSIKPMMPFRYLLSGGISSRNLMPEWTFELWRQLENSLGPRMNRWAMFAQIVLIRI